MILLLIYCCCYNDDDVKDNEDKQWWQCSYLYPTHCIPSPLSPSSLSMTPASIWLYWNLVSVIIMSMLHMMMMTTFTCTPPPQCAWPQSRPVCLPVELGARPQQAVGSPRSGSWYDMMIMLIKIMLIMMIMMMKIMMIMMIKMMKPLHEYQTPALCFAASGNWTWPLGNLLLRRGFCWRWLQW